MRKCKRFVSLLLVVVLCVVMTACGTSSTVSKGPILYKVTDMKGHTAWLFGSIHVGREDFYPLPAHVQNAFDGADCLAVEMDIVAFEKDISQQLLATLAMTYTDGTTIKDVLPDMLYAKAIGILQEIDMYDGAGFVDSIRPVFLGSMIESSMWEDFGLDGDLGIDHHLTALAYEREKEVLEVESAKLQYDMMANFSKELQILLLESAVEAYESPEESEKQMNQLVSAWQSGDEAQLIALLASEPKELSKEEQKLYDEYNTAMMTDRNVKMADYAEEALRSDKEVFICVGAAHIVGEGAMVQLLKERGYTVKRM